MKISEFNIQEFLQDKGINCLYHFTDRGNLLSIIQNGGLLSWKDCEKKDIHIFRPGGDAKSRIYDEAKGLENYVRLSFCQTHPMMFAAKNDGRIADPVIIKVSTKVCELPDTRFSDINATSTGVRLNDGLEGLNLVDFNIVTQNYSANFSDEVKAKYQAEILVKNSVPLEYFINYEEIRNWLTKEEEKELKHHWEQELVEEEQQLRHPTIRSFRQSVINYEDQKVKIHWDASDFTKIKINDTEIPVVCHDIELESGLYQCILSAVNELHVVNKLNGQDKVLFKKICQTINIQQFKVPIIRLTCDKKLIKKQQDDQICVYWDIKYATSATMYVGDNPVPLNSMNGSCVLTLSETAPIYIEARGLDHIRIFKGNLVNIVAKYEAIINLFCSDKQYSITDVPFKISWNVSYANRIYIKSVEGTILCDNLASQGFDYYTLKNRVYLTLCVEDDFGIKEKTIELDVMPKPHVQCISIPAPEIERRINMSVVTNIISAGTSFPKVIDVKTPMFASTKLKTENIKNRNLNIGRIFLTRMLNNSINAITKSGITWRFGLKPILETVKHILKSYTDGRQN